MCRVARYSIVINQPIISWVCGEYFFFYICHFFCFDRSTLITVFQVVKCWLLLDFRGLERTPHWMRQGAFTYLCFLLRRFRYCILLNNQHWVGTGDFINSMFSQDQLTLEHVTAFYWALIKWLLLCGLTFRSFLIAVRGIQLCLAHQFSPHLSSPC